MEMERNPYLKIESSSLFYADDGVITVSDPSNIQELMDRMMEHFKQYDLFPNIDKTKCMITIPNTNKTGCSLQSYQLKQMKKPRKEHEIE